MRRILIVIQKVLRGGLARLDALADRLYGWRLNPLYQSGTLVVLSLIVVTLTGLYLIFFYRIGAPYDSVERITGQFWAGRWIRSLHRYASDATILFAGLHALRLFARDRWWGPRALAWVSGLVLLLAILVCGWTGYVMVWDVQGQVLAQEGARLLDALPIFSEPISRTFVGERPLPSAFFFLNLFVHVALPVGLGLILWLHVSRLARPALLPPRGLLWGLVATLLALSVLWPVTTAPPADLLRIPSDAPYDLFYSAWLPFTARLSPGAAWLVGTGLAAALLLLPWWGRPGRERRPPASVVDQERCTGCEQCWLDCPYDAIDMVVKPGSAKGIVAQVTPERCVSCGICAGSCAPMLVGPPGRTGREQLAQARVEAREQELRSSDVVVIACDKAASLAGVPPGVFLRPVSCVGSVHTSLIEFFLRQGAGGVAVVSCPRRDCWNREGPKWLEERLYHDREAELQARVDRRRVRLIHAGAGETLVARQAIDRFRAEILALAAEAGGEDFDIVRECREAPEGAVP